MGYSGMKRTLKMTIAILTALSVILCMSITASAASMADIAKDISVGEDVECSFLGISSSANYFKIDCGKGDFTINYKADQRLTAVSLYDANGNEIAYKKADATVGKVRNLSFDSITVTKKTYVYWTPKLKSAEGKITYDIENAGTYYIQIGGLGSSYSGTFTFSVDAVRVSKTEALSIQPKITLEVGDTIGVGAVLTPANAGKVTYSYKNNGVISINSKGKVTAKAVGESYVIIKSGTQKVKLFIVVV